MMSGPDLFSGYEDLDEGASTKPQIPHDTIRLDIYNNIKQGSVIHERVGATMWPFFIMPKLKYSSMDRVIRIIQISPNMSQTFYMMMEVTEIFTSKSIR